jgi:hypothetical protein
MKSSILFGLSALLISATAATAATTAPTAPLGDEGGSGHVRLFRYDFNCEFGRETAPTADPTAAPATGGMSDRGCAAAARIFAYGRDGDNMSDMNMERGLNNLLAVACRGELIYANGALLESNRKFVRILAANGGTPSITIPRHSDHGNLTPESSKFEAFLRIDGRKIPGTCFVRARPVNDDMQTQSEMPSLQ